MTTQPPETNAQGTVVKRGRQTRWVPGFQTVVLLLAATLVGRGLLGVYPFVIPGAYPGNEGVGTSIAVYGLFAFAVLFALVTIWVYWNHQYVEYLPDEGTKIVHLPTFLGYGEDHTEVYLKGESKLESRAVPPILNRFFSVFEIDHVYTGKAQGEDLRLWWMNKKEAAWLISTSKLVKPSPVDKAKKEAGQSGIPKSGEAWFAFMFDLSMQAYGEHVNPEWVSYLRRISKDDRLQESRNQAYSLLVKKMTEHLLPPMPDPTPPVAQE